MRHADDGLAAGVEALISTDRHMAGAVEMLGMPPSRRRRPGFATLVRIIIDQQVSVQSGAAVWRRLEAGVGRVTAKSILAATDADLRAYGFSRAKVRYVRCLAEAVGGRRLSFKALETQDEEAVRKSLMAMPGIGAWTADIYLMFALDRPDVWPIGDVALASSAQNLLGLKNRPNPAELDRIGERWRPWRTSAAVLLWHFYKKLPAV